MVRSGNGQAPSNDPAASPTGGPSLGAALSDEAAEALSPIVGGMVREAGRGTPLAGGSLLGEHTPEAWQPIASAPFQTVIEVRNPAMREDGESVLATRGYQTDLGVHPNDTFCTSVFTPDKSGIRCLGFPAGVLVIPTEWRAVPTSAA